MTSRRFPAAAIAVVLLFSLLFAVPRPAQAFLDKTRFVAHLGVAYFCFHHWVVKPYEEHQFDAGAPHRTATIVKAGVALLFAVHEVRVAQRIALLSKDPLLHKLSGEAIALTTAFATIGDRFKSGQFSPNDVQTLKSVTGTLGSD